VWVDTSATFERKLAALRAHVSQIRDPDGFETRLRGWAAEDGARLGVAAAEGFRLLDVA